MRSLTAKVCFVIFILAMVSWAMPPLKIKMLPKDLNAISEGDTLQVLVEIPSGWHLTADEPLDEFLIPLESKLIVRGIDLGIPIYPTPLVREFSNIGIKAAWFEDSLRIRFVVDKISMSASRVEIDQFQLSFQACNDKICLSPTDTTVSFGATSNEGGIQLDTTDGNLIKNSSNYFWMLLLAFIGGLVLNLMPCVLPVLGLKIFSLIRQSGESRSKLIQLGIVYTFGVLASFWALALAVVIAQKAGSAAGWGFQFTHPGFVLFMILVVFLFALNLLGMFEIMLHSKAMTVMDTKSHGEGLPKAFLNGAFMTLIATPCSAPFLGTGMGYALSQPALHLFVFFTVAGLGLALPFLLISFFPGFANKLPRPGAWMNRLKEFMGFTLLATMLWLLFVITKQIGADNSFWILLWLLFIAVLIWIWKNWGEGYEVSQIRKKLILSAILLLILVSYFRFISPLLVKDESVTEFSESMYEIPLSQGKWVFLDYTAEWCITCKVNEAQVLRHPQVQAYFDLPELEFIVADYTRGNELIDAHLKKYQRAGVPLYVLMGPQGQVHVFPEILTQKNVIEIFRRRVLSSKDSNP